MMRHFHRYDLSHAETVTDNVLHIGQGTLYLIVCQQRWWNDYFLLDSIQNITLKIEDVEKP